ncbi:uridine kinase family protein [Streptomyces griseoaurantiacus]|uniref:uridine kinase family protein n=1 Tax=Streptomyces griseoaurantiacus TaxID=68213 RepID=UPI003676A9AB
MVPSISAGTRRSGLVIQQLVSSVRRTPPSCGNVRLLGVDGHAGSGKSTFAGRLAEALGGAPVLHLDDIATHAELFDWTGRLLREVLAPLREGRTAHYRPYDWRARRFGPARALPPAPVVLLEGVGAGRRALRPHLALLLWMELPAEEAWRAGRERDGEEQREFWDGWIPAERRHFAEDPSRPHADLLVRRTREGIRSGSGSGSAAGTGAGSEAASVSGSESASGEKYLVLPGPAGTW